MTFIRTRTQEIRSRAMPVSVLLHLATHLAIAVQQASDKLVCSNDIKPENVFLTVDPIESVKTGAIPIQLADWGLAAHSNQEAYTLAGTAEYASPEIALLVLNHQSSAYGLQGSRRLGGSCCHSSIIHHETPILPESWERRSRS
jgi:serine/threonine protein kinase